MKRVRSIFLVFLALAVLLAACASPANEAETEPDVEATEGLPATGETPEAEEPAAEEARTINLSMILVAPEDRWNFLLDAARQKFEAENPGTTVQVDAQILPFGDRLTQLRAAAAAGTPLDIVSLDQPEVGEFAAAGFTTDLTEWIDRDLNGLQDLLPAYREATRYQGGWHAIWAWTDARVLWFWRDLVEEAGVNPETDMTTWEGYIQSCQRLNEALEGQGIQGCLLIGQPWVADWTLPYAWMNEGALGYPVNPDLAAQQGAVEAWIPAFDSPAWQEALSFTQQQVEAGIEPFTEHQFGPAFVDRRFATYLDGTWVYGAVEDSGAEMSNLGLVAAFPVPDADTQTATMAGGWTLAIPSTSENPEDAWEFLKTMLEVDTLGQMQVQYGYLPTQESFTNNLQSEFQGFWDSGGVERWARLQELAPNAYGRPSFPAWPQVGAAITEMVQSVMFENTAPEQAAQSTQQTVLVDVLQWPEGTRVELHDDSDGSCEHADLDYLFQAVTPVEVNADANGNGSICSHAVLP